MARYKLAQTEIERKDSVSDFTDREIATYAHASMFLDEPYHFVEVPEIQHKIVMSPFTQETITVYVNKHYSDDQKEACFLGDDQIIDLCNMLFPDLPERKTVLEVFLFDGDVVIIDGKLVDIRSLEDRIEPELDFIVGLSVEKNKKSVEDYLIISEENDVNYVTKDSIGKLFIPYMGDWFDAKFPGVIVGDDADDAHKTTEYGLKLLLSMFANTAHAHVVLAKETLPKEGLFSVDMKELSRNDLSNGLSTKQLAPLIKFLKGQNEDYEPRNPSTEFFAQKSVITNPLTNTYPSFESVSWLVFFNHRDRFPMGCSIVLAPGQVITDKKGNEILCFDDVFEIYYKGPKSMSDETKNSMSILVQGNSIDPQFMKRVSKYFKEEFSLPVKAFNTVKRVKRA